jgi:flagellar assembly protein FliH
MAKPKAKPKPFMFDYSFDDGADEARQAAEQAARRAAEEAEANRPPTFTMEELEAARSEAYAKGRQEGMDDAMAGIEQQVARTLDAVFSRVSKVFEQHTQWTKQMEADAARLGLAVIGRLAPELAREKELPEVEAVIREAFGFLTEQPKVMIRVAKELEEPLSGKVELMASRVGYEGQVVLVGDPELPIDDCRVSWQAGAVERSLEDVWGQIEQITERVLAGTTKREKTEAAPAVSVPTSAPETAQDTPAEETPAEPTEADAEPDETGAADPQSIPA